MTHRAVLHLDLGDMARDLAQALAPDDPGVVRVETRGTLLVVEAQGSTPMGLLRTLDDVLVCLKGAGVA